MVEGRTRYQRVRTSKATLPELLADPDARVVVVTEKSGVSERQRHTKASLVTGRELDAYDVAGGQEGASLVVAKRRRGPRINSDGNVGLARRSYYDDMDVQGLNTSNVDLTDPKATLSVGWGQNRKETGAVVGIFVKNVLEDEDDYQSSWRERRARVESDSKWMLHGLGMGTWDS